jgi:hypothetical protein
MARAQQQAMPVIPRSSKVNVKVRTSVLNRLLEIGGLALLGQPALIAHVPRKTTRPTKMICPWPFGFESIWTVSKAQHYVQIRVFRFTGSQAHP